MGKWFCILAGVFFIGMGIDAILKKQIDVTRERYDPGSAFGTRRETESETGFAAIATGIQLIVGGIVLIVVGFKYF